MLKTDVRQNHLLARLPAAEFGRLSPHLDLLSLSAGEVLADARRAGPYLYFPVTAVVCLFCLMETGLSTGVAIVGNEGMVDVALVLGGATGLGRAVVQSAGHVYRIAASVMKAEFRRGGEMQRIVLRYVRALMADMGQAAACNRHHGVEQRLARSLLLMFDRSASEALEITHEALASVLGVRREGVTEAARRLQACGAIACRRGHIDLRDRAALEANACECYRAEQRASDRFASETNSLDSRRVPWPDEPPPGREPDRG